MIIGTGLKPTEEKGVLGHPAWTAMLSIIALAMITAANYSPIGIRINDTESIVTRIITKMFTVIRTRAVTRYIAHPHTSRHRTELGKYSDCGAHSVPIGYTTFVSIPCRLVDLIIQCDWDIVSPEY